ncbi:MAG: hypothetical protein ACI8Z1_003076, partial [Candidatus Azotimanducaceae bacterium]
PDAELNLHFRQRCINSLLEAVEPIYTGVLDVVNATVLKFR